MKHKVNISQLCLMLMLVITGGKFLTLPSVLAKDVGHDSWLVLCVAFAFDAICLGFLLWAIKLNKNRLSFDKILDKTITKVGSKIVLTIFFVLFMCRAIVLMDSCYSTFAVTFDVNTNWIIFMLPIVGVAAFAVVRGFNSIARASQILFALILLSIVALLVYPLTQAQFSQLLPLGEVGTGKIFQTAFMRSFWFSDYIFIYFVLEDIKPQKHVFAPMFTAFAVGVVFTVLLNAVFVALFGEMAQYNEIAMSKIGLFSVTKTTDGRWDWITLTVWLISVMIKIIIYIFCAYKCVEKVFELHFAKTNFIVLGAMTIVFLLPMFLPVNNFVNTFVRWCLVPFALVQYLLPLFMPLLVRIATNKQENQSPITVSEKANEQF